MTNRAAIQRIFVIRYSSFVIRHSTFVIGIYGDVHAAREQAVAPRRRPGRDAGGARGRGRPRRIPPRTLALGRAGVVDASVRPSRPSTHSPRGRRATDTRYRPTGRTA